MHFGTVPDLRRRDSQHQRLQDKKVHVNTPRPVPNVEVHRHRKPGVRTCRTRTVHIGHAVAAWCLRVCTPLVPQGPGGSAALKSTSRYLPNFTARTLVNDWSFTFSIPRVSFVRVQFHVSRTELVRWETCG